MHTLDKTLNLFHLQVRSERSANPAAFKSGPAAPPPFVDDDDDDDIPPPPTVQSPRIASTYASLPLLLFAHQAYRGTCSLVFLAAADDDAAAAAAAAA